MPNGTRKEVERKIHTANENVSPLTTALIIKAKTVKAKK